MPGEVQKPKAKSMVRMINLAAKENSTHSGAWFDDHLLFTTEWQLNPGILNHYTQPRA